MEKTYYVNIKETLEGLGYDYNIEILNDEIYNLQYEVSEIMYDKHEIEFRHVNCNVKELESGTQVWIMENEGVDLYTYTSGEDQVFKLKLSNDVEDTCKTEKAFVYYEKALVKALKTQGYTRIE